MQGGKNKFLPKLLLPGEPSVLCCFLLENRKGRALFSGLSWADYNKDNKSFIKS